MYFMNINIFIKFIFSNFKFSMIQTHNKINSVLNCLTKKAFFPPLDKFLKQLIKFNCEINLCGCALIIV